MDNNNDNICGKKNKKIFYIVQFIFQICICLFLLIFFSLAITKLNLEVEYYGLQANSSFANSLYYSCIVFGIIVGVMIVIDFIIQIIFEFIEVFGKRMSYINNNVLMINSGDLMRESRILTTTTNFLLDSFILFLILSILYHEFLFEKYGSTYYRSNFIRILSITGLCSTFLILMSYIISFFLRIK